MPHFRPQALARAKVWCNSLDVINHANCDSTKYNEYQLGVSVEVFSESLE